MESDDEYEKERQENIQRNRDLMISLGINPDAGRSAPRPATKPKGPAKRSTRQPTRMSERPKRAPQRIVPAATAASKERTRRSARLRDDDTHTRENDGEEQQLSFPRLKRLPNPEPPIEDTINGTGELERAQLPQRDSSGNILFENNNRHFMPNLTPKEMLHGGIFGGTPFRPYYSRTLHRALDPQQEMAEFPADWFEGLDVETQLQSSLYRVEKNRFGVKAGQSLEDWEDAGWVAAQDPRGWWQWYFRFYLGRRTTDDARQIGRWLKACGPAGRFKRSLVSKVVQAGAEWDDETVTPVVRQTLFHWGYLLTRHDFQAYLP